MKKITIFTMAVLLLLVTSAQADLVALWHLDGNADDSSGNNNDGTVYGATYDSGMFGKALNFDGDDYVDCGSDASLDLTAAITIEAWVYLEGYTFYPSFVSKGDVGNYLESYALFHSPTGELACLLNSNGTSGGRTIVWGPVIPLNTWTHVAVTYDGATMQLYINGSPAGSVGHSGGINVTTDPVMIGQSYRSNYPPYDSTSVDGLLDEVRIWDEALSSGEIEDSYELGGAQPDATVVELGEKKLPSGDWVIFTSSFYGLDGTCGGVLDTLNIYMMSNGMSTISGVSARSKPYTPKGTNGCWTRTGPIGGTSTTVTVGKVDCKSIHLSLDLSTGDSVGFNAQFLPYN